MNKQLNERPTPLTDAECARVRLTDSLTIHASTTEKAAWIYVRADFARALEQKLAACREALEAIVKNGCGATNEMLFKARETLEQTKTK